MRIARVVLPLLLFCSGCFLTTELGMPPFGSIRGNDARERIRAMASLGFTIGLNTFEREKNLQREPDGGDLVNAWETGVMTAALAGVQDDRYYVLKSVKDCEQQMLLYSAYYAYSLSQRAFAANRPELTEGVNGGAAGFSAVNCFLVKTGRWISLNERVNF